MSVIFENVNKRFKGVNGVITALNNFSIEISSGEFLCLLGASGAGKSTILRLISGLAYPDSGKITINGLENAKSNDIGMVFQTPALMEYTSVYKNISLPLWTKNLSKSEIDFKVREASKRAEVFDLLFRQVGTLSGGEKQRVALARACVITPSIFLFDEPLNSLDPLLRSKLKSQIKKLHSDSGATFIYVTHDIFEARYLSDKIALIKDGTLLRYGLTESFFTNPISDYEREFFKM